MRRITGEILGSPKARHGRGATGNANRGESWFTLFSVQTTGTFFSATATVDQRTTFLRAISQGSGPRSTIRVSRGEIALT